MNNREIDQAAFFLTKLTVQILIVVLFGVFILTFRYPKVMLPLLAIGGAVVLLAQYSY